MKVPTYSELSGAAEEYYWLSEGEDYDFDPIEAFVRDYDVAGDGCDSESFIRDLQKLVDYVVANAEEFNNGKT